MNVLVTGASRGIGKAIAIRLARSGAHVALGYTADADAAARAEAEVRAAGASRVLVVKADVAASAEADRLVRETVDAFGGLDVLVNNAGIQRSAMAHAMTDADWDDVLAVNLSGVFYTCRAALRTMREARRGQIVNVASASSFVGQVGAASYVASKHGLVGLTKALALEGASRGIRVNAVAPGLTDTDMVRGLDEEQRQRLLGIVPLRRLAAPEEVAELVHFVVTAATYSTGNVFHVTGGVTMG